MDLTSSQTCDQASPLRQHVGTKGIEDMSLHTERVACCRLPPGLAKLGFHARGSARILVELSEAVKSRHDPAGVEPTPWTARPGSMASRHRRFSASSKHSTCQRLAGVPRQHHRCDQTTISALAELLFKAQPVMGKPQGAEV